MTKYSFKNFVDNRDSNEDAAFVLEHLTAREMKEMIDEAWHDWINPAAYARKGAGLVGQAARGVYNMPDRVRAGFHGIDTTKYQVGTPEFQRQLASKQYGVDPSSFTTTDPATGATTFDQQGWDKSLARAKFKAMSPEQQQQYYQANAQMAQQRLQQQAATDQARAGATQARTQYAQAQRQRQMAKDPSSLVDLFANHLQGKGVNTTGGEILRALNSLKKAIKQAGGTP